MLRVPVIKGNLNKALKIFKKKFKSTGVIKELRERKQYSKKSTKKRLIKQKAIHKQKYLNKKNDE
jgi:small subunit ribosomal protein S21